MNDRNIKASIFSIKPNKLMREPEVYSEPLHGVQIASDEEALAIAGAVLPIPKITASKSINWKYIAFAVTTLAVFFLMIKALYEPVEPIIIMDEPATNLQIATAPEAVASAEEQKSPALPDSMSNDVLLSSESIETSQSSANLPAENVAEKEVATNDMERNTIKTDVATADKTPQELSDIELANKKAKQKAKKKTEEAMKHNSPEAKPQTESQPQESIVVQQKYNEQQKEPSVAAEAKKDTIKEAVKAPAQEKSGWSKFTDSIKQGGEAPCSPAQIAMNQCS